MDVGANIISDPMLVNAPFSGQRTIAVISAAVTGKIDVRAMVPT